MSSKLQIDALDEVIMEFVTAHKVPSQGDVSAFQDKYPQFAEEIEETAEESICHHLPGVDLSSLENEPGDEALARSCVEAFDRSHRAA